MAEIPIIIGMALRSVSDICHAIPMTYITGKVTNGETESGKCDIYHDYRMTYVIIALSAGVLVELNLRPLGALGHLDADGEGVFELIDVGDDEHFGKVHPDGVDRFD